MRLPKPNSIEPPRYGPVCPVVWEGRRREAPPYPDQGSNLGPLAVASVYDRYLRIPAFHRYEFERQQRVDLTPWPHRRRTSPICAEPPLTTLSGRLRSAVVKVAVGNSYRSEPHTSSRLKRSGRESGNRPSPFPPFACQYTGPHSHLVELAWSGCEDLWAVRTVLDRKPPLPFVW